MVQVLANTKEQEAAMQRDQEAAGDMAFFSFARFEGNANRLAAVFATADGSRAYTLGSLLDDDNFKYMPKTVGPQIAFARAAMIEKMEDIISGASSLDTLPAEPSTRANASRFYRVRVQERQRRSANPQE